MMYATSSDRKSHGQKREERVGIQKGAQKVFNWGASLKEHRVRYSQNKKSSG